MQTKILASVLFFSLMISASMAIKCYACYGYAENCNINLAGEGICAQCVK